MLTVLLLLGFSTACSLPFAPLFQPATETPTPTASPTDTPAPTVSPTPIPTLVPYFTPFIAPTPAKSSFAPFCQPSSASIVTPVQCQQPIAEQSSAYCSNKTPYNLVLTNPGSTYEISNDDVTCTDGGMKDGKQLVICTGPFAASFEITVCDPACAYKTFQGETTQCPQDLHYNETLGCCEREPVILDQNCVTLSLQTRSCVIACNEFVNQTTCDKNAYACKWNSEKNICQLKR